MSTEKPPSTPPASWPLDARQTQALVDAASAIRERAHAPYSRFFVGAALLGESGRVHLGCNVENASYGLSICAERNAFSRAVSEGEARYQAIAIVTASSPPSPPCGLCRQTMVEFTRELPILLLNPQGERLYTRLSELFPLSFSPDFLKEA